MTSAEKEFLKVVTAGLKTLTSQLIAYQEAVEVLRQTYPKQAQIIDAAQTTTLNSAALTELMHETFDVALENFLDLDHESLSNLELSALVQAWLQKRKPPTN
jgi:hypothetical protein